MSLRQDTNFSGFVQFNRNEVPSGSSSGAKRSQPAPVDTSSSPRRARRLISARKRMTPKRAVMSGARTKRAVMRTADMRRMSQRARAILEGHGCGPCQLGPGSAECPGFPLEERAENCKAGQRCGAGNCRHGCYGRFRGRFYREAIGSADDGRSEHDCAECDGCGD